MKTPTIHPYKGKIIESAMGNRTLNQFAAEAGVDAGNLSRITRGQKASLEVIHKIALAAEGNITYKRLLMLFGPIQNGFINKKEQEIFVKKFKDELASRGWDISVFNEIEFITGFDPVIIVSWIEGTALPTYEDIYCLGDFFGVSIDYLLGRPLPDSLSTPPGFETSDDEGEELLPLKIYSNVYAIQKRKHLFEERQTLLQSDEYVLRVVDDSLSTAGIVAGNSLILNTSFSPSVNKLHAVCASKGDRVLIVRYLIEDNGLFVLRATNPLFDDIPYESAYKIVGVVQEKIQSVPIYSEYQQQSRVKSAGNEEWQSVVTEATEIGISPSTLKKLMLTVSSMTKDLL